MHFAANCKANVAFLCIFGDLLLERVSNSRFTGESRISSKFLFRSCCSSAKMSSLSSSGRKSAFESTMTLSGCFLAVSIVTQFTFMLQDEHNSTGLLYERIVINVTVGEV